MELNLTFMFDNDLDRLADACRRVNEALGAASLSPAAVYAINLALEEMGTNIIKYGYDDDRAHKIELELEVGPENAVLSLIDDGHEFNPLQAEVTDFSNDIAERRIGGMGIHLTKSMTQDMTYARENGRNILRMTINNRKD